MTNLLPRIRGWAVLLTWGISIAVLCIPAFSLFLLTRSPKGIFAATKLGCWLGFLVAGAKVKVRGLELLDPRGTYVFASNHQSNMDAPLLFVFLKREVAFLAKKELFRLPIFYPALHWIGCVPMDRSNPAAAKENIRVAADIVRRGRDYIAFPEGTRSPDGRVGPFKKGPFHLAMEAGVPVVPVTINGSYQLMPKRPISARSGRVVLTIHRPIESSKYSPESVDTLAEVVRHRIESSLTNSHT